MTELIYPKIYLENKVLLHIVGSTTYPDIGGRPEDSQTFAIESFQDVKRVQIMMRCCHIKASVAVQAVTVVWLCAACGGERL